MRNSLLVVIISFSSFFTWTFDCKAQEGEVYVPEQNIELNEKDCSRLIAKSLRKVNWLSKRLRRCNESILTKFHNKQDQLYQNLCLENSIAAEQLIQNSFYSRNRFRNLCDRSSNIETNADVEMPDEIEQLSFLFVSFKRENCDCEELDSLEKAIDELKGEIVKRKQLTNYIEGQSEYLKSVLGDYGQGLGEFISLQKEVYYFGEQGKELLSIFGNWQSGFMDAIAGLGIAQKIDNENPHLNSSGIENLGFDELTNAKDELTGSVGDALNTACNEKERISSEAEFVSNNFLKGDSTEVAELDSLLHPINHWKPNPLKTKRFVDRIEYGCNFQMNKESRFFPTSVQVNNRVSYRLSVKSYLGVGLSFLSSHRESSLGEWKLRTLTEDLFLSGVTTSVFYDHRILQYLYITGSIEHVISRIALNDFYSTTNMADLSYLFGFKVKGSGQSRLKPTMEVLFDFNHESSGGPLIVFRTGINLNSINSYKI